MYAVSALAFLPQCIAAVFAAAGTMHLAGPRWLRETYERWDYPVKFQLVAGVLNMAAAALLAEPELRMWGIFLAEAVTFFAVITLLSHGRYLAAVPVIVLMIAIVPTALSIPHHDHFAVYAKERPLLASAK